MLCSASAPRRLWRHKREDHKRCTACSLCANLQACSSHAHACTHAQTAPHGNARKARSQSAGARASSMPRRQFAGLQPACPRSHTNAQNGTTWQRSHGALTKRRSAHQQHAVQRSCAWSVVAARTREGRSTAQDAASASPSGQVQLACPRLHMHARAAGNDAQHATHRPARRACMHAQQQGAHAASPAPPC